MMYKRNATIEQGPHTQPPSSVFIMPPDLQGHYWAHRNFHSRVITRMSTANRSRARGTTRFSPTPYPSSDSIIARMDEENDQWYHDTGTDLHPRDFMFQARIQTAHRLSQRAVRFPSRDRVLERLLEEGTFDREAPELRSHSEEYAMAHSSAMVNRLLMCIETLESQVSDYEAPMDEKLMPDDPDTRGPWRVLWARGIAPEDEEMRE